MVVSSPVSPFCLLKLGKGGGTKTKQNPTQLDMFLRNLSWVGKLGYSLISDCSKMLTLETSSLNMI